MALRADRVAFFRSKLCRIDHGGAGIPHVLTARAVTALAAHAVVEKRWIGVPVLGSVDRAQPAGVARETGRIDGTVESNLALLLIARRGVPGALLPIPRHRQLEQIPLARQ